MCRWVSQGQFTLDLRGREEESTSELEVVKYGGGFSFKHVGDHQAVSQGLIPLENQTLRAYNRPSCTRNRWVLLAEWRLTRNFTID